MSAAKLEIFSEATTEAARLLDFLDLPGVSQALAMRARERLASSMDSCGESGGVEGGGSGGFGGCLSRIDLLVAHASCRDVGKRSLLLEACTPYRGRALAHVKQGLRLDPWTTGSIRGSMFLCSHLSQMRVGVPTLCISVGLTSAMRHCTCEHKRRTRRQCCACTKHTHARIDTGATTR